MESNRAGRKTRAGIGLFYLRGERKMFIIVGLGEIPGEKIRKHPA